MDARTVSWPIVGLVYVSMRKIWDENGERSSHGRDIYVLTDWSSWRKGFQKDFLRRQLYWEWAGLKPDSHKQAAHDNRLWFGNIYVEDLLQT